MNNYEMLNQMLERQKHLKQQRLQQQQQLQQGLNAEQEEVMDQDQVHHQESPFDIGIHKAIRSAKKSVEMDQPQQKKALRSALLNFAKESNNQERKKGFFANFNQIGRALTPAIEAYDHAEDVAIKQNKVDAQYQQALAERERANVQAQEKEAYHREALERKAEEEDHGLLGSNLAIDENGLVDGKFVPFKDEKERKKYTDLLTGTNKVISQVSKSLTELEEFKDLYKDSINAYPVLGSQIAKGKGLLAGFVPGKRLDWEKESNDRLQLDQSIGILATKFEKELKGGILTKNILDRFEEMNLIPKAGDSLEQIKAKLDGLSAYASEERSIAIESLMGGYHHSSDAGGSTLLEKYSDLPHARTSANKNNRKVDVTHETTSY